MIIIKNRPRSISLRNASLLPQAGSYLWNHQMMLQINCQGYATAQFLQPEPASYAVAPVLQATTFMQPEQPVYAHHPGRFFYIKDEHNDLLCSVPFAPIKAGHDTFEYIVEDKSIRWLVRDIELELELSVCLDEQKVVEHWELSVRNQSRHARALSIYPYFPIGYRSWMNQSAKYDANLGAIICDSVTPYQRIEDHEAQREFQELCFLMSEQNPDSWEANQAQFEGSGGLHKPAGVGSLLLERGDALYETPCAAMQFRRELKPQENTTLRFAFGAAKSPAQLKTWREEFFDPIVDRSTRTRLTNYPCAIHSPSSPDHDFDNFVNLWLPRQIQYHNDLHRLSTDPQTRNFLQDTMGLVFLDAGKARENLQLALSQQNPDGSMPDGVLLNAKAKLKYINQVPHTDHAVWLVIAVHSYLSESNDMAFLTNKVSCHNRSGINKTVYARVCDAVDYLASARDHRDLNFIEQGDWCDPMNMVGYKGKGVSIWLTLATAYAARLWAEVAERFGDSQSSNKYITLSQACNTAANKYGWDGHWYARGITDGGRTFGIHTDQEGKIFLNPQSWAMLSGAADKEQRAHLMQSVDTYLVTPWGLELLNPAYTAMQEDIGRITQKFPGTAENGSVYNHAAVFYAFALYQYEEADAAYATLKKMLPGDEIDDQIARGQLPNFIPNYYRGAGDQYSRPAGRSSQLFHTGTVHWYLRCIVEGLFGLRGHFGQLEVSPQLPSNWEKASVKREFLGACFSVSYQRNKAIIANQISVDGIELDTPIIRDIKKGHHYNVEVSLPYDQTSGAENE